MGGQPGQELEMEEGKRPAEKNQFKKKGDPWTTSKKHTSSGSASDHQREKD